MFQEKNIISKSDLERNQSLSRYLNFTPQQNHHTYEAFFKLLNNVKPKRILEIGTGDGGLTGYLHYMCKSLKLDTEIRTYDIHNKSYYQDLISNGIDVRIENIFEDGYTNLKNKEIIDFIEKDGRTVILCDGGNKVREFNILSEYIKKSDIIMAHDYAKDEEFFKNNIYKVYWNWHEISDSKIKESVVKYGLKSFMQTEFDNAVWVCKIKEE
jgi:hypothetical protein